MSNSGSPRHGASNGTAQAIRGGEDSASNAVRCCSGKVTGTTTLQLLPARSTGSSASLLMATSSATAPGTTTKSPAGDFRHPDYTRSHEHLRSAWTSGLHCPDALREAESQSAFKGTGDWLSQAVARPLFNRRRDAIT